MIETCDSRETVTKEPCRQPVGPSTTRCAAGHVVDSRRWAAQLVYADALAGTNVSHSATIDLEEVVSGQASDLDQVEEILAEVTAGPSPVFHPSPSQMEVVNSGFAAYRNLPYEEWRLPDGTLHRDPSEGPAVTFYDGSEHYYVNGKLHRLDGPAVIDVTNQTERWYRRGELVHNNGQPAIDDRHAVPITVHDAETGVVTTHLGPGTWQPKVNRIYRENFSVAAGDAYDGAFSKYSYIVPADKTGTGKPGSLVDTVDFAGGTPRWSQLGPLHNRWKPAKVTPDGGAYCYIVGRRHCVNGHPAMREPNGTTRHFVFGEEVSGPGAGCSCD